MLKRANPAQFESWLFPTAREVVRPYEVALVIGCSEDHVVDLIEEGSFVAAPINDKEATTRMHRRIMRWSVEGWWANKLEDQGHDLSFLPPSPQRDWWREQLRQKEKSSETVKQPGSK